MDAAEDVTVLVVVADVVRLALPVAVVAEVLRMVALTPLPGAPAVISGLVDLRGRTVPVLDLRRRLGCPGRAPELDDRLVVVADAGVAVHVDEVVGLRTLDPAGIEPLAAELARTAHLVGVSRADGELIHLHDAEAFLSEHEEADLARALATTARGAG